MRDIKKVGLIGGGVIGSAWAARLLINGYDVTIYDPVDGAEHRINQVLESALRAYRKMTWASIEVKGQLTMMNNIKQAVENADFVQESGPERIDVKKALFEEICSHTDENVIIASSSSGLLPSEIQAGVLHPHRVCIGHPFNPVYLMPLVEVVGGNLTSDETKNNAAIFYRSIGMHPLIVRKEIEAFLADRLMEALWREALHLLNEDVATAEDLDQAICYGPGIRWAFMGSFLTFRIAGGEGGMRHFMSQFGPSLKWPWTRFDGPELTEELLDKISNQSDDQANGRSILELERLRDDCIVSILQGLRANGNAAGQVLANYEEILYTRSHQEVLSVQDDFSKSLVLHKGVVQSAWVDYNNHMTESSYLQVMGDASDALFRYIGVNQDYHQQGMSYFTVETHMMNLKELNTGESFSISTQLLSIDEKRIHLFHMLVNADNEEVATAEQMLLHVNTKESKACPARADVYDRLQKIFSGHKGMAKPEYAGRSIAQLSLNQ